MPYVGSVPGKNRNAGCPCISSCHAGKWLGKFTPSIVNKAFSTAPALAFPRPRVREEDCDCLCFTQNDSIKLVDNNQRWESEQDSTGESTTNLDNVFAIVLPGRRRRLIREYPKVRREEEQLLIRRHLVRHPRAWNVFHWKMRY